MYVLGRYLSIYMYTELTNDSDFAYLTAQIGILCIIYSAVARGSITVGERRYRNR